MLPRVSKFNREGITGVAVYRSTLNNVNLHSLVILQTVVPHSLRMIEIVWELVIHKKLITLLEITVINYIDFSLDVM